MQMIESLDCFIDPIQLALATQSIQYKEKLGRDFSRFTQNKNDKESIFWYRKKLKNGILYVTVIQIVKKSG